MFTQKINNLTIEIDYDLYPSNPREEIEQTGIITASHRNYDLADKNCIPLDEFHQIKDNGKFVYLPVYMYEHSGIALSTTPFSCRWDSGQVGYIYITKEQIRKEFYKKRISKKLTERIYKILDNEIKTYSAYANGECYGFTVYNDKEEMIDSLGGYFDFEACKQDAIYNAK